MIHEVLSQGGTKVINLNRRTAIRHFCLGCSDFVWDRVVECESSGCLPYSYRLGRPLRIGLSSKDRADSIIQYCMECSEANGIEKEQCDAEVCALFPYRNGNGTFILSDQYRSDKQYIIDHLKGLVGRAKLLLYNH
jgi:hypothetical protein